MINTVMLATGIECSIPTIKHGTHRMDELALTDHYKRWREDLHLVQELGIHYLRYGIPYYRVNSGPGQYDWSFTDEVFQEMRSLNIEPIVDLCHFGMPDWLGNNFQNPEFPQAFAEYAAAFANRYPWVTFYTPINEIYVCAKFSALYGWWNEQETSHSAFIQAIAYMARGCILAMDKILNIQPNAIFVQSESNEYTHNLSGDEQINKRVEWENQIRFLALDFLYGNQVRGDIYAWLVAHGLSAEEYTWFMTRRFYPCVLGTDYYVTNERMLDSKGEICYTGEVFGWYLISLDYYRRYRRPLMHTETNMREEANAVVWLWKQWQNILRMRADGIPVMGFTWYSLLDQVDWDVALREANGTVNSLGLYTLERKIRPVGEAYRNLIEKFCWLPVVHNSDFLSVH